MAAKAEKTGSSVSCFNSSKSYDTRAVESATTEVEGKKSFFQKLLGTKKRKIVGIAIASIVVAMTVALTVALAASLGGNSPGVNGNPPVNGSGNETFGSGDIPPVNGSGNEIFGSGNETLGSGDIPPVNGSGNEIFGSGNETFGSGDIPPVNGSGNEIFGSGNETFGSGDIPPVNGSGNEIFGSGNETFGSGEIPPVNGSGNEIFGSGNETFGSGEIPPVNGTGTPVISAETPVITTETPTEPPTINRDNYPSPYSLCGYKPDAARAPECAQRPFSLYENLNTEGMSESDLRIEYVGCVTAHTSTPCNNNATAFSNMTDRLPDNVIYAFVEQGGNSTLPVYYDAGFSTCTGHFPRYVTAEHVEAALVSSLLCSARKSDIEALPSNCACVPDNTINPNDVPSVAPPTLPVDIYESPSDSICGSRFSDNSSPVRQCTSLASYNNMENLSEAETNVVYEDCVFDHTDAACKRLPIFANVTIDSDRVYRFEKLDAELSGLPELYNTGFLQCVYINIVIFHNKRLISDGFFAELKTECLIERAVAAAALSNCKCLPTELGTITLTV